METTKRTFKTSLNCGNCVSKVQADLDQHESLKSWTVDTNHPDKLLTVEMVQDEPEIVVNLLKRKGFTATAI
jgi:tRNA(Ser,Leu) C12 N-acetylase TAN1